MEDSEACKCRIEEAEKLIQSMARERHEISFQIEEKQFDRDKEISNLECLFKKERGVRWAFVWQKRIIDFIQQALKKPCFASKVCQQTAIKSLLTKEEDNFYNLHFQILHGTNSTAEEKQLIREIDQSQGREAGDSCLSNEDLETFISWFFCYRQSIRKDEDWLSLLLGVIEKKECTRKAIANVALKGMIWDSFGSKKAIQEEINLREKELEEIKKELMELKTKIRHVERCIKAIENDMVSLHEKLAAANQRKSEIYQLIDELRKRHDGIM
ncbi:hypothetical protein JCGZ_05875 [Jatropha curcas]|uniref:Uncharacterized protein n=1 Tax=Jatropha curcas TaxID=180498 RepID=A0A067J8L2_JATCU|nr:uncharacterized protein LOC105650719 [Jatropha curcas]KDP20106.1 hypothetical protein JCGZ_05875 [Jatropha curcas]